MLIARCICGNRLILVSWNIHVKLIARRSLSMMIVIVINVGKSRRFIRVIRWIIRHLNCSMMTNIISSLSLMRDIVWGFLPLKNVMMRSKGLSPWRLLKDTLSIAYLTAATMTTISTIVHGVILHDFISNVPQITIDPIELSLQSLLLDKYLLPLVFKCAFLLFFAL